MENYYNLKELVLYARDKFREKAAFYIRNKVSYDTITFDKFTTDILKLASSLLDKGYSKGKHIALIGENSYDWIVAYLATVSTGAVVVPVDKELPEDEILNVVKSSDSTLLFFSSSYASNAKMVQECIGCELIIIDKSKSKITDLSAHALIEQYSGDDYQQKVENVVIDRHDMSSIVFTSGTTGVSKGVMLTHNNQITNIKSCFDLVPFYGNRFSLLPLHHSYELTLGLLYPMAQGCTTSINNSIKYITQNLQIFAPTDLVLVPLIVETFYNSIWDNIRKEGKENLMKNMIKFSNFLLKCGIDIRKKLFKKIHAALGGKVINIFCGGAHIDAKIAQFFVDMGYQFNIGYGITECSPLISGNVEWNREKMGSCGYAATCCEIDIFQPNEIGDGEIIVKGENVMLGYYKKPEATAEVIKNGWFHTGDMGRFDEDGRLYITGRIKNIIVLKNGKNIYPEEIEGYLYQIPYIKEVVVYALGDSSMGNETALAAEIYPNEDRIEEDKLENFKELIKLEIDKINSNLAFYKRISHISYRDTEFIKTTTRKIKRNLINGKQ